MTNHTIQYVPKSQPSAPPPHPGYTQHNYNQWDLDSGLGMPYDSMPMPMPPPSMHDAWSPKPYNAPRHEPLAQSPISEKMPENEVQDVVGVHGGDREVDVDVEPVHGIWYGNGNQTIEGGVKPSPTLTASSTTGMGPGTEPTSSRRESFMTNPKLSPLPPPSPSSSQRDSNNGRSKTKNSNPTSDSRHNENHTHSHGHGHSNEHDRTRRSSRSSRSHPTREHTHDHTHTRHETKRENRRERGRSSYATDPSLPQRMPSRRPVLVPEYRYCARDGHVKPMRAHHCRICGTVS